MGKKMSCWEYCLLCRSSKLFMQQRGSDGPSTQSGAGREWWAGVHKGSHAWAWECGAGLEQPLQPLHTWSQQPLELPEAGRSWRGNNSCAELKWKCTISKKCNVLFCKRRFFYLFFPHQIKFPFWHPSNHFCCLQRNLPPPKQPTFNKALDNP